MISYAAALLVVSLYHTPVAVNNDTPEVITKEFKSYGECEADKELQIPALDAKLEQGLLAYSITCSGNETTTK